MTSTATDHPSLPDKTLSRVLLRLLSALRKTPVGDTIYQHVEIMLNRHESAQQELTLAHVQLLTSLLNTVIARLHENSPLQVQLKLMLLHLVPSLSIAEIKTLQTCLESINVETVQEISSLDNLLTPVVTAFNPPQQMDATPLLNSGETTWPTAERRRFPRHEAQNNRAVDAAYRRHLHEKQESIERIQETLAHQIADALRQHNEFSASLSVELDTLQQARNLQEIDLLRSTLITQVGTLQNAHQVLTHRLAETQKHLRLIETDSQQLSDELTRVQLLSLTDELTELPNRRAFIRRLEDEVGRVQRYGNNLPLVIIDIDSFKAVNDQHGRAVGDYLLRYYAKEILSVFRHHDLVARYGGEEFAVLLPNTDIEGAIRAVAKVQRRAAECTFNQNGQTIPVPTFSAGIASYLPGETPTDFIERADSALYRAKNRGKNRVELALEEGPGAVTL